MTGRVPVPAAAFLGLAAFALGYWLGARRVSGAEVQGSPSTARVETGAPVDNRVTSRNDEAGSGVDAEIAALLSKVTEAEARLPRAPTPEQTLARGREIAAMIFQSFDECDGEARRRWMAAFYDLSPEMAPAFAEAFLSSSGGSYDEFEVLAAFALEAGGPGANEFLGELLRRSDPDALQLVKNVLNGGLVDMLLPSFPRLALDNAFAAVSIGEASSPDPVRRRFAVSLLRRRDGDDARAALQLVAETDPDPAIQGDAIRSLACVGNAGTIEWLERLAATQKGDIALVAREAIQRIRDRQPAAPPPPK